jgi:iron complex outermembrane receptor protein
MAHHDFVLGVGFRTTEQNTHGSFALHADRPDVRFSVFSGFVQDEITAVPDRVWVTVGSKFESNNYTGFNVQPTLRLRWQPRTNHLAWAAVSRAVRTPSNYEEFGRVAIQAYELAPGMVSVFEVFGSQQLKAEQVLAYELGYRMQPLRTLSLDWAGFYNQYHNLVYCHPEESFWESSPAPAHLVFPYRQGSNVNGRTYGLELSGSYFPVSTWKVSGTYSWLRVGLTYPDYIGPLAPGDNPEHQFTFRSLFSLPHQLEFDTGLFYISKLPAQGVSSDLRLDARFGWRQARTLN